MKKFSLLMLLCVTTLTSNAQELESILLAREDASKLTESYMNPAMKGLIYGMSSGWYHTAKVHDKLGFDISIGFSASMVPSKDELITFANLGLTSVTSSSLTSPTLAGTGPGALMNVNATVQGQNVSTSFTMPEGISKDLPLSAVPTPAIQLSVGLPYKFDVMLRLVPEVGSDDVKGKLFGLGLKKELTSLLGPIDRLPLHLSFLAAYTSMDVNYRMDGSTIGGVNQHAKFKLNSFTAQAIASLNFPIINIYGGLGFSSGKSDLDLLGTYNLEYSNAVTETVTDPLNLDFKASGLRGTLGARLSLGFFKIFADYTLQEYNTASMGIAFSFR
ncbi:hypothetical protein FEZ18_12780 [Oceanihabitans sp. IOP_32]|uniref:DUF6588 family protein n=1 Tax=Oceanihabitans sp. IOP_32 TaxID=2529032 RepID=UPI0012939552|nr:DUF6588 family protein [Oceanihabitans sp. IOP_32]QFZ55616.1 hypothetical protein FEZ18_12780 [Oceanihabitans sp. IOP_32]